MQWLGSEQERRVAQLHIQILVSFTSAAGKRTTALSSPLADATVHSPAIQSCNGTPVSLPGVPHGNDVQRQDARRVPGSESPRIAAAVGEEEGTTDGSRSHSRLESYETTKASAMIGVGRTYSLDMLQAQSRLTGGQPPEGDDDIGGDTWRIAVAPYSPRDAALRPRNPPLVSPAAVGFTDGQQAAAWQLPGMRSLPSVGRLVTGIPVGPWGPPPAPLGGLISSSAQLGLHRRHSGHQHTAQQDPGSQSQPELAALIARAERLQAAMCAAISASCMASGQQRPSNEASGSAEPGMQAQPSAAVTPDRSAHSEATQPGNFGALQSRTSSLPAEQQKRSLPESEQPLPGGEEAREGVRAVSNAVDLADSVSRSGCPEGLGAQSQLGSAPQPRTIRTPADSGGKAALKLSAEIPEGHGPPADVPETCQGTLHTFELTVEKLVGLPAAGAEEDCSCCYVSYHFPGR